MNIRYCLNMLLSNSYSPISFLNIVLIFSYEFFLTKKKKKLWTKFSHKNSCSLRPIILLNKINITTYFENLTVELHVLYTLNTHVKFCVNRILFTI